MEKCEDKCIEEMRPAFAELLSGITVVDRSPMHLAQQLASQQKRNQQVDEAEQHRERERRFREWRLFIEKRGTRYGRSRLSTFIIQMPKQQTAINKLMEYEDDIRARVNAGENLLLFGPPGTGKDHLAVAICREAIREGIDVEWVNGMDLFGRVRDAMTRGSEKTERSIISEMTKPQLLYISDPVPPIGNLTEFQQAILFRVLDVRYSKLRPIIATVNVSGAKELTERIGAQNAERMRDGALAIHCDWPSYRRVKS